MSLRLKTPELLPPAAADCAAGVRLLKIHEEEKTGIINRSARSTYRKKKSVLTTEATPDYELLLKQRRDLLKKPKPWFFQANVNSLKQMRWEWNHVLAFDPLPALKNVTCPVLGVFGELDPYTDASAAARNMRDVLSAAGNKDFTVKIFPGASHSLAEMPSGARMAPGVFETLRSWLLARIQVTDELRR